MALQEHTVHDYLILRDTLQGQLILAGLEQRFGTAPVFVAGGHEGDRETCRRIGQREVIDYIHRQLHIAATTKQGNE